MKIGDIRMELPTVDSEIMLADRKARRCEVVWIHPKWRFYTVEFTTELGWKFRESFYFRDRDPNGPPLPEHVLAQRQAVKPRKRRVRRSRPTVGAMWIPMYGN